MISWIQRYFQHHFKTVFAVLLGVIIIAFVFTIGAAPGIGNAERRLVDREFFGYNLGLERDQQRLMGDAALSANLRVGAFGGLDGEQIQNYAFHRAAALHLADEWHIPPATDAEIKKHIEGLRAFAGQDNKFDSAQYTRFRDNLKTNPRGLTEADVRRVIADDVRAEKVQQLLAGPGYVLPSDVKTLLTQADTNWTVATATIDYASFKAEPKPTDAELTQFFEQSGSRYDIPPRVALSYVEFPAANYLSKVNVTDADVRQYYDANPSRFPKPADAAKPATPTPTVTTDTSADFAAVRPKVEEALKLERAQKLAAKDASDLSVSIYEAKLKNPSDVDGFLAKHQLVAKSLPPFSREAPPQEFAASSDAVSEAFRLSKDRIISDPVHLGTGAAILFWKDSLPSQKPPFATVRDRVLADYVENDRRRRFVELGKTMKSALETRLKAGDDFEKAANTAVGASGLKVETKKLADFTPRTRPQDIDYAVLSTLERLEKGQVSDMVLSGDKGLFVYAVDKKVPDLTDANPRFAETRAQIARYSAQQGAAAYISELVAREMKKSEPKTE